MEREPSSSVVAVIQDISRRNVTALADIEEQYLTIAEEKLGISPKKTNSTSTEFKPEKLSSKELTSHVIRCLDYLTTLQLQSLAQTLGISRPETVEAIVTELAQNPEQAVAIVKSLINLYPEEIRELLEEN